MHLRVGCSAVLREMLPLKGLRAYPPYGGGAQCCDGRFIRQRQPDLYTQFRPAETCAGVALFITKKKPLPPYRLRDEAAASRGESAFGGGTGAASNPS